MGGIVNYVSSLIFLSLHLLEPGLLIAAKNDKLGYWEVKN